MPSHVVLAGQRLTSPSEVLERYAPAPSMVTADEWAHVRAFVVGVVCAADYPSPWAALIAVRYTTRLVVWARGLDMPLDAEVVFGSDHVNRFVASELAHMSTSGRSSVRSYLRRVARAANRKDQGPRPQPTYPRDRPLARPYTASEVAGFWDAADAQATQKRTRVLTVMLSLGLGAGLKPREMLTLTSHDVRRHPTDERLTAIFLPDRTVPVLGEYTQRLRELCTDHPVGPLIGPHRDDVKDPLAVLRKGIEVPSFLPRLRAPQLRTTWMVSVLSRDVRISEFMAIAGTVSAKSLESVAPYVPGRWSGEEYLFKGAGLC